MKLDRKVLLILAVALLFFARLIGVSSRRAVHSVLTTNLEAAARAQAPEISRSLDVGLQKGNERLLAAYLRGSLGSLGASYAAALDEEGIVLESASVAALSRVPGGGDEPWVKGLKAPASREAEIGGHPVLELAVPSEKGALLLGYRLEEVLRTEARIAMKIFIFTGVSGGLILALLALLMKDLARREEHVRQTEKLSALGRLAAGVAHEINNPLGSILGFAQAAAARLSPSDGIMPALRGIEEEALRCRNLVQNLLTFSRQGQNRIEEFDLGATVEATLSMIEAQARVQGVAIVRELAPGLRTEGDRGQVQQVVMNLCANAVDAMPEGGRLTVRSGPLTGGGVYLEVEDEGPGVPPEIRGKIFDPFFTTKEVGKGTGLGLSLVHEIVVRHRGTVEATFPRSRGSLFRVTLGADLPRAK